MEIQSQLANILRHLADGVGTGGAVRAGVVGVPHVGGVGGDGGTACGGGDYT